tara:strand:- start:48 stop:302 length:255 start_codon:yes stop_codon:yes gene_type:complete
MRPNEFSLAKQVVKEQYNELMHKGLPFLQIFPEMIQEADIAETFKRRGTDRNKSITQFVIHTPQFLNEYSTFQNRKNQKFRNLN